MSSRRNNDRWVVVVADPDTNYVEHEYVDPDRRVVLTVASCAADIPHGGARFTGKCWETRARSFTELHPTRGEKTYTDAFAAQKAMA